MRLSKVERQKREREWEGERGGKEGRERSIIHRRSIEKEGSEGEREDRLASKRIVERARLRGSSEADVIIDRLLLNCARWRHHRARNYPIVPSRVYTHLRICIYTYEPV